MDWFYIQRLKRLRHLKNRVLRPTPSAPTIEVLSAIDAWTPLVFDPGDVTYGGIHPAYSSEPRGSSWAPRNDDAFYTPPVDTPDPITPCVEVPAFDGYGGPTCDPTPFTSDDMGGANGGTDW